jgi:transporter family-2 protein
MKMHVSIFVMLLSLLAGMMIPFQSAMNAQLGKALQSPYYAALSVFIIAAAGLMMYLLLTRQPLPDIQQWRTAPKWSYLGGFLGGCYILLIVICAPKLGIGNVTILVLLGQVLSAVIIDHFGFLQSPLHHINWQRLVGVILVLCGVYLVKKY